MSKLWRNALHGMQAVSQRLLNTRRRLGSLIRVSLGWRLLEGSDSQARSEFERYVERMEEKSLQAIDADEMWRDLKLDSQERGKA